MNLSASLFCLALFVIERYTTSYAKAQQLSGQLRRINASLQRFVPAEFLAFLRKASISERMKPDDVFSFLNGYLELVRPVDRINAGEQTSFLFEVYANDSDTMRDLKWRTQSDLEHALYAWFSGHYDEARIFLEKILQFYPEDPVASHYARRLEG